MPRFTRPELAVVKVGSNSLRGTEGGLDGPVVVDLTGIEGRDPAELGQAVTEGALLARYRYRVFRTIPNEAQLLGLTLVSRSEHVDKVRAGVQRGLVTSRAVNLARDLGNTPATHLTATRLGEVAIEVGAASGLHVDVHDQREMDARRLHLQKEVHDRHRARNEEDVAGDFDGVDATAEIHLGEV